MGADIIVELDLRTYMVVGATGSGECVFGEKRGVSNGRADRMDADDDTGEGDTGVVEGDGGGFGSI